MSEARKCDRCHGYFELSKEDQKDRDYSYDMKGTYVKIMLFGRYGEVEKSVRWYDLCPNCMESLDKWLANPDIDDIDCADRSNGATEKELELASKLNEAKIYIAQLKNELGYTITKEEIEVNSKLNEYGCPGNIGGKLYKCVDCRHFTSEPNPFNSNDHKGVYICNLKKVYISGNCSRPAISDMTPKDFCNLGCNFDKETREEEK